MSLDVLPACMSVHVWCLREPEERASDPLELELHLWVTIRVLGIEPGSSAKADSALNHWAILPALALLLNEVLCCNLCELSFRFWKERPWEHLVQIPTTSDKSVLNIYNVHWWFVYMYVCLRVSEALELELQTGVSCHVGAGNWTRVLWKSSQYS